MGEQMINMMGLVDGALSRDFPDCHVSADYDTDIYAPAIKYLAASDGQQANGPGLWVVTVDLSIVADAAVVGDLVRGVYEKVHAWQGVTFPEAHVNRVEDVMVPQFAGATPFASQTLVQYSGTFSLVCRTI